MSKSVYIDKLANIVKKYNKTYHSTIKMKSIEVKSICGQAHILTLIKNIMREILNLKLVIM